MNSVITCEEHDKIKIVDAREPGKDVIEMRHAEQLEKLKEKLNLPNKAFTWGHRKIKFAQYCGVINLGDLTIEVLPKIHGGDSNAKKALVQMLSRVGVFKTATLPTAAMEVQKFTLLDLFIHAFCENLRSEISHGKDRNYINVEENLGVLRGRLLIDQQFKYNLAHQERLFCRYDELSEDTLINQIFKFTLKLLLQKCRQFQTRKVVTELLMKFDGVSDTLIQRHIFDRVVSNRTNARFDELLVQSKRFIEGSNPDVNAGTHSSLALMFDMNRLFEKWVASEFKKYTTRQNLRLIEQEQTRKLASRENDDVFTLKPDYRIADTTGKTLLIADAKWKKLDKTYKNLGILESDVYQLTTYAVSYGISNVCLIYPWQDGLEQQYEFQIQLSKPDRIVTLSVITLKLNGGNETFIDNFMQKFTTPQ